MKKKNNSTNKQIQKKKKKQIRTKAIKKVRANGIKKASKYKATTEKRK